MTKNNSNHVVNSDRRHAGPPGVWKDARTASGFPKFKNPEISEAEWLLHFGAIELPKTINHQIQRRPIAEKMWQRCLAEFETSDSEPTQRRPQLVPPPSVHLPGSDFALFECPP